MKRVLVTRPEPSASATAVRLREMRHEPVVMPLSRIVAMTPSNDLRGCDAVAATSANALRHAPEALIAKLRTKHCYAVGAKTALEARKRGFDKITQSEGDAISLADAIIAACKAGSLLAYLTGRVRLPEFERALTGAGFEVVPIEVYDTLSLQPSDQEIEALRAGRPIDAALIYSAKAAEAVKALVEHRELAETFLHTVHCCLSERIAEQFDGIANMRIRIAERPEEAAILELLEH